MERIDEQHLVESGLVVFDVTVADEATALQVIAGLERMWVTFGTAALRRTPGTPGVQARVYAGIRYPAPSSRCPNRLKVPGVMRGAIARCALQ
ncbi:DUF6207 family protein [Streptomyces cyaneofuscatus]